jgi:hypothetical protein
MADTFISTPALTRKRLRCSNCSMAFCVSEWEGQAHSALGHLRDAPRPYATIQGRVIRGQSGSRTRPQITASVMKDHVYNPRRQYCQC